MKKFKSLVLACGLIGSASIYADDFSWQPHVMPDVTLPVATYISISGGSIMTIRNDTDQPHSYHMDTEIGSSCGQTEKRYGRWQENFTVAPHSTFQETHNPQGYVKCNMAGQKDVILSMLISAGTTTYFYKTYQGVFHIKPFFV